MKKLLHTILIAVFCYGCTEGGDNNNAESTGSIYGVITDKATGEPIRSAGVLLNPGGKNTTTGNDGQYEFPELTPGDYTIAVTKTGYADLTGHKITVTGGKTNKGDVQLQLLPPSLRVTDNDKNDISELDFGIEAADLMRSFNIFNDGPEKLEWEITETCDWITKVSKENGVLNAGATHAIVITIDREKLSGGRSETTIHITSNNGSKIITVIATKPLPVVNTLEVSNITASSAKFNGTIVSAGTPSYTERGFVYSRASMPTLENTIARATASVTSTAGFSANVETLAVGERYYVRAYAINSVGIAYSSNEVSFVPTYPNIVKAGSLLIPKVDASNGCNWGDAVTESVCASYVVDGVSGWRLPTRSEMLAARSAESLTFSGSYWVSDSPVIIRGSWCGGNINNYDYSVNLYYVNMNSGTSDYYTYRCGCTTGSPIDKAVTASTAKYRVRCVKKV